MNQDYWNSLLEPERAWEYTQRYADFWLNKCRKYVRTLQDAEDLYGDAVLVNVVKISEKYDAARGSQYTTFMHTALHNRIITEIRKKQGTHEKSVRTNNGHVTNGKVADSTNGHVANLENKELITDVLSRLQSWNKDAHSVYVKRKVENMYVTDIALIHNVDRSVVYRLIAVAESFIKNYSNTSDRPRV
jgi:RNA polymerase sigma factor (sigma-70 family)